MNGCTGPPVHLLNLNNQEDKNNLLFTIFDLRFILLLGILTI